MRIDKGLLISTEIQKSHNYPHVCHILSIKCKMILAERLDTLNSGIGQRKNSEASMIFCKFHCTTTKSSSDIFLRRFYLSIPHNVLNEKTFNSRELTKVDFLLNVVMDRAGLCQGRQMLSKACVRQGVCQEEAHFKILGTVFYGRCISGKECFKPCRPRAYITGDNLFLDLVRPLHKSILYLISYHFLEMLLFLQVGKMSPSLSLHPVNSSVLDCRPHISFRCPHHFQSQRMESGKT